MAESSYKIHSARIPALDGVRGVAIFAVMLYHFTLFPLALGGKGLWQCAGRLEFILANILLSGWTGVDLFFVLSGFLITGILADSRENEHYFFSFYRHRFLRIFPLYFLFLILSLWFLKFFPAQISHAAGPYNVWLFTFTSNLLIALKGLTSIPLPLLHVWSLAIEEHFYLVWPFIILFCSRRKAIILCLLLMLVALTVRIMQHDWLPAYVLTHARVDALAAGSLLALLSREVSDNIRLSFFSRLLAISSFAALVGIFVSRGGLSFEDRIVTTMGFSVLALFFMAFVALCRFDEDSFLVRAVSIKPLRLLGKYSYGVYLIHQPLVIFLWSAGLMNFLLPGVSAEWELYRPAAVLLSLLIPMFASVSIAIVSWHGFEQHFLKRKDSALELWSRAKPAAVKK